MKKSYMVALIKKFTVSATIYREVIADSAKEAKMIAKKEESEYPIAQSDWIEEVKSSLDFDGALKDSKIRYVSAGPSSQYHSESECKLCHSLKKNPDKL